MHPKYLFGIIAVGIYVAVIALVFYYFGYHHTDKRTRFTAKKGEAITVNLQSATSPKRAKKSKAKPKPKSLSRTRQRTKPKPIAAKKLPKTKPTRPVHKASAQKPIKAKSLFAQVKPTKPDKRSEKKSQEKASRRHTSHTRTSKPTHRSIKQQTAHQLGIENRYLADVQNQLYGWPTQPGFVGEKITIGLTIYPSGQFKYEVLIPSSDPEFNRTIRRYLDQLLRTGFGPTPGGKSYVFKVDIVAK